MVSLDEYRREKKLKYDQQNERAEREAGNGAAPRKKSCLSIGSSMLLRKRGDMPGVSCSEGNVLGAGRLAA